MKCSAVDISYAHSNNNLKLSYSGISLGGVFSGTNIPFYQKKYLAQSAQKIADHVWMALKDQLELNHTIYVKVTDLINSNGSVFVKLEIIIHNRSKSFGRQINQVYIKRESFFGEDNHTWTIIGASCVIPEGYQGKSPKNPLPKPALGIDIK